MDKNGENFSLVHPLAPPLRAVFLLLLACDSFPKLERARIFLAARTFFWVSGRHLWLNLIFFWFFSFFESLADCSDLLVF